MKKKSSDMDQPDLFTPPKVPPCPDFENLLKKPIVTDLLPSDFSVEDEVQHLKQLWDQYKGFWKYQFNEFVHAGGSGMVFQVSKQSSSTILALKIARKKLFEIDKAESEIASALSPVSESELRALEKLSHPNVVRLYDTIGSGDEVIAIATTYVDDPKAMDTYFVDIFEKAPKGVHPFSPARLIRACDFLIQRSLEVANSIAHMHSEGIFHFDIKSANILISSEKKAVLTDLGACIHKKDLKDRKRIRVHFTWTYAHPDLQNIVNDPANISGGGLKASAEISLEEHIGKFDLFAFGRSLQECLAKIENEFGERAYAVYGFRFLHLISSLLLDGQNAPSPGGNRARELHERRFVSDTAMEYPVSFFESHKIKTASELVERLNRHSREYSWNEVVPELDSWNSDSINTGIIPYAPFTKRISNLLGHPSLRRLKSEMQLGWIREVYPNATHNRWSHSLGVFSALITYYNSLLSDPELPTLRIIVNPEDIEHAMIAAIIHDLGQLSFGHDLEESAPNLYDHERIIIRLLNEEGWNHSALKETLKNQNIWPKLNYDRLKAIITKDKTKMHTVDGLAVDIINGPIDADKYDYLMRDSIACGVPYGKGIDYDRFIKSLTVNVQQESGRSRLILSYKAKGAPAIESLLIARYQMYGAVYWHHTFRCIKAMFAHAVAETFGGLQSNSRKKFRSKAVIFSTIKELLYHWAICGKTKNETSSILRRRHIPEEFFEEAPSFLISEKVIEFVWKFANDNIRALLQRLGQRDLYKRVFELKISELGEYGDYSALKSDLPSHKRPELAMSLQNIFMNAIDKKIRQKETATVQSIAEAKAHEVHYNLRGSAQPLVVIDFPMRGIPNERNFPHEIGDSSRKYLSGAENLANQAKVFHTFRDLQMQKAALRVFAAPELHELIIRYLDPMNIRACVEEVIEKIKVS